MYFAPTYDNPIVHEVNMVYCHINIIVMNFWVDNVLNITMALFVLNPNQRWGWWWRQWRCVLFLFILFLSNGGVPWKKRLFGWLLFAFIITFMEMKMASKYYFYLWECTCLLSSGFSVRPGQYHALGHKFLGITLPNIIAVCWALSNKKLTGVDLLSVSWTWTTILRPLETLELLYRIAIRYNWIIHAAKCFKHQIHVCDLFFYLYAPMIQE